MKVVIVADINIAEDVSTCVLGYSSKNGWEDIDVTPRPLPSKDYWHKKDYADGWNDCLDEITGEKNDRD